MLKEGIFRLLNVITLLKPLTPLFLQRDFIISSTFDLVTQAGRGKKCSSIKCCRKAGRGGAAVCGCFLWPRHYVHKWISEWSRSSADVMVAAAKQNSVDVGAQQRKKKSG